MRFSLLSRGVVKQRAQFCVGNPLGMGQFCEVHVAHSRSLGLDHFVLKPSAHAPDRHELAPSAWHTWLDTNEPRRTSLL